MIKKHHEKQTEKKVYYAKKKINIRYSYKHHSKKYAMYSTKKVFIKQKTWDEKKKIFV